MAGVASLLAELDDCVRQPVLVFGSLPPEGRDLDVVARPPERRALERRLELLGFESKGFQWARFRNGETDVVDVVPVETWRLPANEVEALLETGTPLPGMRWLARPAPLYALLILARKLVRARTRKLDGKARARIDSLVREDPDVWMTAAERATAWGAEAALSCLRHAYSEQTTISRVAHARAIAELARAATGRAPMRARLRPWTSLLPRPRRGALVTLSGLDGAGKSSQAAALQRALDTLGYRPVREWAPLGGTPSAMALVAVGRPLLRQAIGATASDPRPRLGIGRTNGDAPNPARRSNAVRALWVTILVALNAAAHLRAKMRHAGRGRTMIFDRYVLDSAVQLRHNYGDTRVVRVCIRLLKAMSPKATRAYLLDVSPDAALERKQDLWSSSQLRDRARLYRNWHERFEVVRLDGERPPEALAEEIARDVWRNLGKPR